MAAVMTTPMPVAEPLPRPAGPTPRPDLRVVAPPRAAAPGPARVSAATYRRRRILVALAVVGAVLVAGRAGAALGGSSLAASERRPSVVRYVVAPGDSLWTVAQHVAPGADLRPVVDQLARDHGGTALQPGETVVWKR